MKRNSFLNWLIGLLPPETRHYFPFYRRMLAAKRMTRRRREPRWFMGTRHRAAWHRQRLRANPTKRGRFPGDSSIYDDLKPQLRLWAKKKKFQHTDKIKPKTL
jgi:hypothetical protein